MSKQIINQTIHLFDLKQAGLNLRRMQDWGAAVEPWLNFIYVNLPEM